MSSKSNLLHVIPKNSLFGDERVSNFRNEIGNFLWVAITNVAVSSVNNCRKCSYDRAISGANQGVVHQPKARRHYRTD